MKKGFTLIELLAVIVILAIIALIATPIVLNIIEDAKKSATLRSADFYLNAVEQSIASATLKNKNITDNTYNIKDGDICLNENCTDKLEVEVNGDAPKEGTVTIANGNITGLNIILSEKEITKNSKGELVYVKTLDDICKPSKEQKYAANLYDEGYKYECKVDPNKDAYTFYVLNTRNAKGEIITESTTDKTAASINLIMAQNINSDGTPTTKAILKSEKDNNDGIYNLVAWVLKEDYGTLYPADDDICLEAEGCILSDKGPLTAMKYLSNATKTWTNTNEMIIDKFDNLEGTKFNMQTYNTYARMPYYSEVGDFNNNNGYLYENLDVEEWTVDGKPPTNSIENIRGYWTLSADYFSHALAVDYDGFVIGYLVDGSEFVGYEYGLGVRPVINLKY